MCLTRNFLIDFSFVDSHAIAGLLLWPRCFDVRKIEPRRFSGQLDSVGIGTVVATVLVRLILGQEASLAPKRLGHFLFAIYHQSIVLQVLHLLAVPLQFVQQAIQVC